MTENTPARIVVASRNGLVVLAIPGFKGHLKLEPNQAIDLGNALKKQARAARKEKR